MTVGSSLGVLAVIDGYRVTGPARQVLATAADPRGSRFTTTLAIFQRSRSATPFVEAATRLGVPTRVLPDRFPGDPRTALAMSALARRPEVDILETHGYKPNVLACLLAVVVRKPWIAYLHGETWENAKVRAYFALERLAVRWATRVVVMSHDMARRAVAGGIPSAKVEVVHNACALRADSDATTSAEARPLVGVIGRLSPEKGVDVALRVHREVVRRVKDAELLVAGEGPERAALERHAEQLGIASCVRWLGYQEDHARVYRQLAVVLIPSRSEGLPNVALEAMVHGIPVVATAVGGIPEVVTNGENGFLAQPENTDELASRVAELLEAPHLRTRLGLRGRDTVASRFSPAARMQALVGLYEKVTA
jgi:glycosyltransferase involved in cell wall biosynthesis